MLGNKNNPFESNEGNKKTSSSNSFQSFKSKNNDSDWDNLYVGLKQDTLEVHSHSFENHEITGSLFNDREIEESPSRTYQIHKKYIVSSIKSGMLVINQSRAHQRILYEQFLTNITVNKASSQQLLFPLELYFSNDEVQFVLELKPSLENTGFVFDSIEKHPNLDLQIVPVGLNFINAPQFADSAALYFGEPIDAQSFVQNNRHLAVASLKKKIKAELSQLTTDISLDKYEEIITLLDLRKANYFLLGNYERFFLQDGQ